MKNIKRDLKKTRARIENYAKKKNLLQCLKLMRRKDLRHEDAYLGELAIKADKGKSLGYKKTKKFLRK